MKAADRTLSRHIHKSMTTTIHHAVYDIPTNNEGETVFLKKFRAELEVQIQILGGRA
jgi:hypothetical protein